MSDRLLLLVAVAILGTGCADYDAALEAGGDFTSVDGDTGYTAIDSLRIDVYPSGSFDEVELLPQSWEPSSGSTPDNLDVRLSGAIELSGVITGYRATPYADPEVPGSRSVPVSARIEAWIPGTIVGHGANTDEDGAFSMTVTPGQDFVISAVPTSEVLLPFQVWSDTVLGNSHEDYSVDLGYGAPVYGVVTDAGGTPLSHVNVRLVEQETGVEGPVTQTEDSGHFMLRALNGRYTLVFEGESSSSPIPRSEYDVVVESEQGARVDVDLGRLDEITADGTVTDSDGKAIKNADVLVRFTSSELYGVDGELVVETETDQNGIYFARLLPGRWTVEYMPAYDSPYSPTTHVLDLNASVALADVALPGLVTMTTRVKDSKGNPTPAYVTVTELGYQGNTWSGTTDAAGRLEMDIPVEALHFAVTPMDGPAAITHFNRDVLENGAPSTIALSAGRVLSGRVSVDGISVPYAVLKVLDQDGNEMGETFSLEDGSFSLVVE